MGEGRACMQEVWIDARAPWVDELRAVSTEGPQQFSGPSLLFVSMHRFFFPEVNQHDMFFIED
jgi:hypothetical protein